MRIPVPAIVLGGGLAVAACSSDSRSPTAAGPTPEFLDVATQAMHVHIMPTRAQANGLFQAHPGGGAKRSSGTGILYHGGPIIQFTKVAAIYWSPGTIYSSGPTPGSTGSGARDGSLVGFFLRNLGGSPYFNINTTYFNGAGTHVANSVTYTQFFADNSNAPSGGTVSDAAVQAEVINALASGKLAFDPATLYAVFSANGVNLGGGFGTQYCAYHGHFSWNGNDVKYAVMPYDFEFPSGCTAQGSLTPNGDPAADAEVNTLAHETEETTTDEDLNAWFDRRGQENADKCAWTFGTEYTTLNGAKANMNLGGKNFLIQRNWVNAGSGGCLVSF